MPGIPAIDQDSCIACEVCTQICPEVFRMGDGEEHDHDHDHGHDEKATVYNPTGAPEEKIEEAMDNCPSSCIYWE